jgi:hypothetical protein
MMKEFFIYDTNFCSLIERPLRRTACPESIRRVQGTVRYSPFTIDHSRL